ncbi:hypothetical protein KDA23_03795 [Candidatus Saccharibacteria bacterium]|nr:hypothetical protein [Candidatus Saccharibacteria bacterium]
MRKLDLALFVVVGGIVIGGVVAVIVGNNRAATDVCTSTGANHVISISNGIMQPQDTLAQHCDTLTVINKDDITRRIAFGVHDHHQAYDGVSEKILHKGESLTVTLIKTGDYHVHDHYHDATEAEFTVK